jgi:hypothetical protein
MPVVAFAPMPEHDRAALDTAFRGVAALARIAPPKRESPAPRPLGPPPALTLRVAVELPKIEIPENLFGEP